jgi:hypothetical protein
MAHNKARALAALLLLVFARLATAAAPTSQAGDNLPPMNAPIVLRDDPSTPTTAISDNNEVLSSVFAAADEAAHSLMTAYPEEEDEYDYSFLPLVTSGTNVFEQSA